MTVSTLNLLRSNTRLMLIFVVFLASLDHHHSNNFSPVTLFYVLVYAVAVFVVVDHTIERRVVAKRQEGVERAVCDD